MVNKILIVDGNDETRKVLAAGLGVYDGFEILLRESPAMAAKVIETQDVSVLITEIDPSGMEGFRLISHVKKNSPNTRILAMANRFTSQLLQGLKTLGVPHYLRKPIHMDSLIDFIFEGNGRNPQSRIHGVTLASFLQLMNIEQKTCTLDVVAADADLGRIYIQKGEVVGARTGDLTGQAAFFKLMEWDNPEIRLTEGCRIVSREIFQPLMHLLMESHQNIDESGGQTGQTARPGPVSSPPLGNQDPSPKGMDPQEKSSAPSNRQAGREKLGGQREAPDQRSRFAGNLSGGQIDEFIRSGPLAEALQGMQAALFKIVGPMAKVIFRDAVREWLRSQSASELDLSALGEVLIREIRDPDKGLQYEKMISAQIKEKEPVQAREYAAWHMADAKNMVNQVFKTDKGDSG